jgi:Family of unknown function (DUF6494)
LTPAVTGSSASADDDNRPGELKPRKGQSAMNEDVLNTSIRKFLKTLGVSAQREIEKAVRNALADGKLSGNEKFPAKATVIIRGLGVSHEVDGEIELE